MIKAKRALKVETRIVIDTFREQMNTLNSQYLFRDYTGVSHAHMASIATTSKIDNNNNRTEQHVSYTSIPDAALLGYLHTQSYFVIDDESPQLSYSRKQSQRASLASTSGLNRANQVGSTSSVPAIIAAASTGSYSHRHRSSGHARRTEKFFQLIKDKNFFLGPENLPMKKISLNENSQFLFQIATVIDPFEIYMVPNFIELNMVYDDFDKEINAWYLKYKLSMIEFANHKSIEYNFVMTGKLCVVNDQNNKFLRALVIYTPPKSKENNEKSHYLTSTELTTVLCIDCGRYLSVHLNCLFPIFEDFCKLPMRCVSAQLHKICPDNALASEDEPEMWSEEAIRLFDQKLKEFDMYKGTPTVLADKSTQSIQVALGARLEISIDSGLTVNKQSSESHLNLVDALVEHGVAKYSVFKKSASQALVESDAGAESECRISDYDSASCIQENKQHNGYATDTKNELPVSGNLVNEEDYKKFRVQEYVDMQYISLLKNKGSNSSAD